MTMATGMDVQKALRLSFQTAHFAPISDCLFNMLHTIENGGSLSDAFARCAFAWDQDFLSSIETGEQSGNVPELMERMSRVYLQEALFRMKNLSVWGGWLVYGLVAICIIVLIFSIFSFYLGTLQDALKAV